MKRFLFITLIIVYGCENNHKKKSINPIQYIQKEDVIDELKTTQQTLKLNYYEYVNKEKSKSNIGLNYMLDISYQSKIRGNIDSLSHFELTSMSNNLTIYKRGKNTFLLSVSNNNPMEDSILYDIYLCSQEKKYVNTYTEKKDTVTKILLFQRKEFLGHGRVSD